VRSWGRANPRPDHRSTTPRPGALCFVIAVLVGYSAAMLRHLIALTLLIPALATAQVYKWIDTDGKIHYSDRPVTGAETLGVPVKKAPPSQDKPAPGQPFSGPYAQFEIVAPEDNATLRDPKGKVQVGLLLAPALFEGHRLQIRTDGTPATGDVPGTQVRIDGLSLGSHRLQAQILDAGGTPVAVSSVVHFHLLKPEAR
jgi:hypothetical protein